MKIRIWAPTLSLAATLILTLAGCNRESPKGGPGADKANRGRHRLPARMIRRTPSASRFPPATPTSPRGGQMNSAFPLAAEITSIKMSH